MKRPYDEIGPGVRHEELSPEQRERGLEPGASRPGEVDAAGRGPVACIGPYEALAGQPLNESHRDGQIREEVLEHLRERGEEVRGVQANVRDGLVQLEGRVASEAAKRSAESAAATVAEARGVTSRLRVSRGPG